MKPQSAKNKGRILQQWIRDKILATFPSLQPDDVRSTSMGAGGVDVQLSPAAQAKFSYAVESKNLARHSVHTIYAQAQSHSDKLEPLIIIKVNRKKPLVVVDAEHFFELVKNGNSGRPAKG